MPNHQIISVYLATLGFAFCNAYLGQKSSTGQEQAFAEPKATIRNSDVGKNSNFLNYIGLFERDTQDDEFTSDEGIYFWQFKEIGENGQCQSNPVYFFESDTVVVKLPDGKTATAEWKLADPGKSIEENEALEIFEWRPKSIHNSQYTILSGEYKFSITGKEVVFQGLGAGNFFSFGDC